MMQKKICLLGAFAVGKTSLAARFVQGIFPEKYLTTLGVKIDRKIVQARGQRVALLVWDIAGEDEFHSVDPGYVRGAAGYLLVADGTRRGTFDTAIALQQRMEQAVGPTPFTLLLNKSDLAGDWEITEADLAPLRQRGWEMLRTSARGGEHVEAAFTGLAGRMLDSR
jgi:hypothetical protein